jgi:hypothetical protein
MVFDTLDRQFSLKVLKSFYFNDNFCKWIQVVLKSTKLSLSVNGRVASLFSHKREVRQCYPLAPQLFGISEEQVLCKGITKLVDDGIFID